MMIVNGGELYISYGLVLLQEQMGVLLLKGAFSC
jgi:hypothetical protein